MLGNKGLRYTWGEIADSFLLEKLYPVIIEEMNRPQQYQNLYLMEHLPKNSDGVNGVYCQIPFRGPADVPIRLVDAGNGTFPSAGKRAFTRQNFRLAMMGAGAQVTAEEVEAMTADNSLIPNIMVDKVQPVVDGFPKFLQALVRSPQSGIVAYAGGSESSLGVLLTQVGLPNAGQSGVITDRTKLLCEGMYLQWYRGTAKLGDPVKLTYVDHDNATIYYDSARGVTTADWAVLTTIDGLEDGYIPSTDVDADINPGSPGIYDLIGSVTNTVQGTDRSIAANYWARPHVKNMSNAVLSLSTLRAWLRNLGYPPVVVTAPEVVDYLYTQLFRSREMFINTKEFVEGPGGGKYPYVSIDNTKIISSNDALQDHIDCVNFEDVQWKNKGEIKDPFNRGWYPLPKTVWQVHDFAAWGRLVIFNPRRSGTYYNFVISTTIGA